MTLQSPNLQSNTQHTDLDLSSHQIEGTSGSTTTYFQLPLLYFITAPANFIQITLDDPKSIWTLVSNSDNASSVQPSKNGTVPRILSTS